MYFFENWKPDFVKKRRKRSFYRSSALAARCWWGLFFVYYFFNIAVQDITLLSGALAFVVDMWPVGGCEKEHLTVHAIVVQTTRALLQIGETIVAKLDNGVSLLQAEVPHLCLIRIDEWTDDGEVLSCMYHAIVHVVADGLVVMALIPLVARVVLEPL